jgi:hypothetical protein
VFLVTTAKSGPGISTSTVAKARNSPYVAQVINPILARLIDAVAIRSLSRDLAPAP